MGIFGNSKMKLFAGSQKVKKAYLGTEKIYSAGSIVTYYVDSNTYYQEEVDSDASCLNPTTFTPSKSGWTFVGWREDTTASGDTLSSKIMGDEPITLYAVFKQTIYLYYNGNGSTSGSVSTQSGTRYYNAYGNTSNPSFTLASNGYSRTGHNFNGWDLGVVGATITLSSSMTAYAQWTAINYYFDINGADNGLVDVYINGSLVASGVSDYYQQHPYGSTYEIKNIRPKSGYKYDGVTGGSLSGTITGATTVTLSFSVATTYAFQNGSLGSGISVSGASVSDGKITAGVGSGAWSDWEGDHDPEEAVLIVTISGLDLTNFSKLYISSTSYNNNHYGEAYCNVGIDTPHTQRFFTVPDGQGSGISNTFTITLDVSGYTGVHSLQFYLYAYSHSSYSGYQSGANLGITEIRLYN